MVCNLPKLYVAGELRDRGWEEQSHVAGAWDDGQLRRQSFRQWQYRSGPRLIWHIYYRRQRVPSLFFWWRMSPN